MWSLPACLGRSHFAYSVSVDERTGGGVPASGSRPSSKPGGSCSWRSAWPGNLLPPQEHLDPVPELLVSQPLVHTNPARDMALIPSSQMRKLGPREAKQLAQNHSSINQKGIALGANSPLVPEWGSPST